NEIGWRARVARTFQNIRLFQGMTALENLMVAHHNTLMLASGFTVLGLFGAPTYRAAEAQAVERAKYWLDKIGLTDRARHVRRHADFGSRGGARLRHQDRRRHADRGAQRSQGHRRLSRRRRRR